MQGARICSTFSKVAELRRKAIVNEDYNILAIQYRTVIGGFFGRGSAGLLPIVQYIASADAGSVLPVLHRDFSLGLSDFPHSFILARWVLRFMI
jgi:hypothetical protein